MSFWHLLALFTYHSWFKSISHRGNSTAQCMKISIAVVKLKVLTVLKCNQWLFLHGLTTIYKGTQIFMIKSQLICNKDIKTQRLWLMVPYRASATRKQKGLVISALSCKHIDLNKLVQAPTYSWIMEGNQFARTIWFLQLSQIIMLWCWLSSYLSRSMLFSFVFADLWSNW